MHQWTRARCATFLRVPGLGFKVEGFRVKVSALGLRV